MGDGTIIILNYFNACIVAYCTHVHCMYMCTCICKIIQMNQFFLLFCSKPVDGQIERSASLDSVLLIFCVVQYHVSTQY